jgi:hypothetical protein
MVTQYVFCDVGTTEILNVTEDKFRLQIVNF